MSYYSRPCFSHEKTSRKYGEIRKKKIGYASQTTQRLYATTQASKSQCFKSVQLFWLSSEQNRKSKEKPYLNNLCVRWVFSVPFSIFFPFTDLYESFNFLSLSLRNSIFSLGFPLKSCAGNWRKGDHNWPPRACSTFDRCIAHTPFVIRWVVSIPW